jgi:ferritin-like metal-binding protein YciE
MESIRELLLDEMKDLYDAEKQLVKALPKVAKASSNPQLSDAFQKHLNQTQGHVERLERAFELMGEKAKSKPCAAMQGLIEEADEAAQEEGEESLTDSAIICAAQKVEHYEIAGYGTVAAWARGLGLDEVADLLQETLDEEKAADEKLTDVATDILAMAASQEGNGEEEAEPVGTPSASTRGSSMKNGKDAGSRRSA